MDDEIYSTSPCSDISLISNDSGMSINSTSSNKKNRRKRSGKKKYQQFIKDETSIFEYFNSKDYLVEEYCNDEDVGDIYELEAKNEIQENYIDALNNSKIPIIFSIGPAGTGKTFIACHYAITSFLKGHANKIIITRPTVSVDEEHGYLPGDLNDKMKPWLRPIYDIFEKYISNTYLQKLIKQENIEICPLAFMRGRTFENAIIIADEMQNSTESQMKMILTRISFDSKLIINGDLNQSDNNRNGLKDFLSKYKLSNDDNKSNIKIIEFMNDNIQRHPIIETILNIYK